MSTHSFCPPNHSIGRGRPTTQGPHPRPQFHSLQSAAVFFIFLVLSIALLLSEITTPALLSLPPISSSVSPPPYSFSSIPSLAPPLPSRSLISKGLWALKTGLSLYVEAFIPEGCHKLLDVVSGVEGSTKCELEDSKLRAVAILDLVFVIHVLFVLVILFLTYAVVARTVGNVRSFGSYEALPTAAALDSNHIQLKELAGFEKMDRVSDEDIHLTRQLQHNDKS